MKQRKTREQKIITELRRKLQSAVPITPSNTQPMPRLKISSSYPVRSITPNTYPYLAKDLTKTVFVTTAILGLEIAFSFFLKMR